MWIEGVQRIRGHAFADIQYVATVDTSSQFGNSGRFAQFVILDDQRRCAFAFDV
jgi:hypothetical protein